MAFFLHPLRPKSFASLIIVLLFLLTACAGNSSVSNSSNMKNNTTDNTSIVRSKNSVGSSNGKNSGNTSKSKSNVSSSSSVITITVGGKQDTESQLLTKMYALLLRHSGFNIVEHASSNTNDAVFNAITSGHIDLSPAFTATGLGKLGLNSTGNAQLDYLQLKQGYEAKYQVTWLEPSPLNGKIDSSAPVVRDSVLKKAPQVATTLNKLAPILNEQVSQQLQSEVVKNGRSVTEVATQFLQSKGLL